MAAQGNTAASSVQGPCADLGGLVLPFSTPRDPPAPEIHIDGPAFRDAQGRRVTLRGVNLGGSSKVPAVPDGRTHITKGFLDTAAPVSFVGRPFALDEADSHFRRLRAWGSNVVRLVITWEAVEHKGPGEYDHEYLRYLGKVVDRAGAHGIQVYIDPHHDVWARHSGGDGAPAWTFAAVGLDVTKFETTGAALVHQTWGGEAADKGAFPRMCWPTNMHKLACATMCTLFWAGDAFAPDLRVDGVPVQRYLQGHYLAAMAQVATELRSYPNVLGVGTMNEPLPGYVGVANLGALSGPLKNDLMPTPFEGMALASGHALRVGRYNISSMQSLVLGLPVRKDLVNAGRESAWLPGHACVWRRHGVWGEDARGRPRLLRPAYFKSGDFGTHHYVPFVKRFAEAVRTVGNPQWMIFAEMPPADLSLGPFPKLDVAALGGNIVHAPHWYDQLTLFLGRFVPWMSLDVQTGAPAIGRSSVERLRARQVRVMVDQARTHVCGAPVLIGEVGIPFDMHGREVYGGDGASAGVSKPTHGHARGRHGRDPMANCEAALAASVSALDANDVSYTLWCYTADHDAVWGDGWNREDLSLYSRHAAREVPERLDPAGVHLGGRALRAFVRPYAQAVAGTPVRPPVFDPKTRTYKLTFRHDPRAEGPSLVFVPSPVQYPEGFVVGVSDGHHEVWSAPPEDGSYSIVSYEHDDAHDSLHVLIISPRRAVNAVLTENGADPEPPEDDPTTPALLKTPPAPHDQANSGPDHVGE